MILTCAVWAIYGIAVAIAFASLIDVLRRLIRFGFGPEPTRIRVIGPKGPEDVLMEGEEKAVWLQIRHIPVEYQQGWRIEKIEAQPRCSALWRIDPWKPT